MNSCGLKTLNLVTPSHFRRRAALLRPLYSAPLRHRWSSSVSSSASLVSQINTAESTIDGVGACCCLPSRVGEGVTEASRSKLLQVVLVSPQIPGNTGCIARTCAASAVGLHLVEPLGFQVDSTKLKRAGLDYWPFVVVKVHNSWAEFREYFQQQEGEKRLLAFTKRGTKAHSDFLYRKGDWLVFGSETSGLPPEAILDCESETLGGGKLRIPMVDTYVRCLNLSVSVGIALYEASRQLDYEQLRLPSESTAHHHEPIITEDIFA
uniref:tRNA/rRNA methyltransferase SpoU type domain-containing protein n=1 Tax=Kalanchoe fedtschenkoi TaxID=63787 RepID=A0A7N0ZSE3_KALFE